MDFSKNEAKFLLYLFNNDNALSRELEIGANLRQPEVSVATHSLLLKKLIQMEPTQATGEKGRPLHRYFLAKPKPEIVKDINIMFMARINTIETDMKKFNDIFAVN